MHDMRTDTDFAIRMRGVTKIFGDDPKGALELLRSGKSKADVQAETNHVVGLDDVSLDIARGRSSWSWACRAPASRRSSGT